jgi:hypothetical protein
MSSLIVPEHRRLTLNGLRHRYDDPFRCKKFLRFIRRPVKIFSGQWKLYWRSGSQGYTPHWEEAGTWRFEEAYRITQTCGREKKIEYILTET